jgi:heme/copper-type cytochrome/quinol oxidase subunit 3
MNHLTQQKNIILKIVTFIILFQTTLFGSTAYNNENSYATSSYVSESANEATTILNVGSIENREVALDSFGSISVMILLVLTSLLGAFFVRDEFSGFLK